jgi:hypothetical protein
VDTFFWDWDLATLSDGHSGCWLVSWVLWDVLNLLDNVVALEDFAEDNVSAVKVTVLSDQYVMLDFTGHLLPWGRGGDEELRAIGVLAGVGHRHKTLLGMLELEVLIWELLAID